MNKKISQILAEYLEYFPEEQNRHIVLKKQLENNEDMTTRKNFTGHLTAGTFILHPTEKKIFLIHNKNLDKWLAPRGHFELGDKDMIENSIREAREESGFQELELHPWHKENNFIPIDIDTHYIPENPKKGEPEHGHHDFRYAFVLKELPEIILQEEEVSGGEWRIYDENLKQYIGDKAFIKLGDIF